MTVVAEGAEVELEAMAASAATMAGLVHELRAELASLRGFASAAGLPDLADRARQTAMEAELLSSRVGQLAADIVGYQRDGLSPSERLLAILTT